MPFLACSLFTTLAVRRNCLICSLLRVGSSDAVTKDGKVRHTAVARISLRQRKGSMYIAIPPRLTRTNLPPKPPFDNLKSNWSNKRVGFDKLHSPQPMGLSSLINLCYNPPRRKQHWRTCLEL